MNLTKITKNLFKLSKQEIQTPPMKLLFQPATQYNNIILKLEFTNIKENPLLQKMLQTIKDLELTIWNQLKKQNNLLTLSSQVIQNKQFDPYLITKWISKKTKFNSQSQIHSLELNNILEIPKNTMLQLNCFCDSAWITNTNKLILKWKVKDVYFC